MKREKSILILFGVIVAICIGFWYVNSDSNASKESSELVTSNIEDSNEDKPENQVCTEAPKDYAVQIFGAVKHPGVYSFSKSVRICQVVEAAGGLLKNAEVSSVNQARFIEDGEQIHILTQKEAQKNKQSSIQGAQDIDSSSNNSNKININTAGKEELMKIPGIGEAKATAIIDYRTEHGNYTKIEDIMNISGIKSGVYNKIKDQITV